jgi:hypothetical protein
MAPGSGSPAGSPGLDAVDAELARHSKGRKKADRASDITATAAELDKLYSPENFKGMFSLYFNVRFVKTGDEVYLLTPAELEAGSQLMATSARLLLKIDPAYVALIMLCTHASYLIATKEIQHGRNQRAAHIAGERAVDGR